MIAHFSLFDLVRSQNIKEDVQLKGGLVFKPEGLAQINQDYTQYIRSIATSALQTFAQQAYSAIQLYTVTFCNIIADIHSRNFQMKLYHYHLKYILSFLLNIS